MKTSFTRLIITIAVIIVVAWLIMLAFKLAAWLINGLVAVAAIILVIALISHFLGNRTVATKKAPLRIEREPSKEKK